ncbi:MAG: hypothetical protein E7D48_12605 [Bifidobacterium scardovii]|uniref:hypothetical protein n=1 Tax=Bifidobacterium scardovii TaxID=158787 RepID=UPI0028FE2D04|nr:hypothetical protein [Bifidobacterium scardovii]MDU2422920.1 hypothetical protein [Bifidobacterium scardovii]
MSGKGIGEIGRSAAGEGGGGTQPAGVARLSGRGRFDHSGRLGRRLARFGRAMRERGPMPMWWRLLAAFLVFAVFVTGAFIWQSASSITAQKIENELFALDPSVSVAELESKGYVNNGDVVEGWRTVGVRDFPWYVDGEPNSAIEKFVADARSGRESVVRLYTQSNQRVTAVRVLWYDPYVDATWAERTPQIDGDEGRGATIHYDGKGQIREWWWERGALTTTDKRFSRGIEQTESDAVACGLHEADTNTSCTTLVLRHQPSAEGLVRNDDSIRQYDEVLYVRPSE